MTCIRSTPRAGVQGWRRPLLAGAVLVVAVNAAAAACRPPGPSSGSATTPAAPSAQAPLPTTSSAPAPRPARGRHPAAIGEADGVVPEGATVFDGAVPAVARLDPDLLTALRLAASHAADDGITFYVNSGWRSPRYQDQLLRKAVSTYGSEDAAARWVATAETSPHVRGDAVDIGHSDATAWLAEQGAEYGLCQIYRNEPWHYELRPQAVAQGCPRMYANPTQDPRMQR